MDELYHWLKSFHVESSEICPIISWKEKSDGIYHTINFIVKRTVTPSKQEYCKESSWQSSIWFQLVLYSTKYTERKTNTLIGVTPSHLCLFQAIIRISLILNFCHLFLSVVALSYRTNIISYIFNVCNVLHSLIHETELNTCFNCIYCIIPLYNIYSTYIEIRLVETIPRDIYQNIVFPSQQYSISLIRNSQDLTHWSYNGINSRDVPK